MLVQLASQQPVSPIEYMRDYFDNVVIGTPPLNKAFAIISLNQCYLFKLSYVYEEEKKLRDN
jgi:hypothetical protein